VGESSQEVHERRIMILAFANNHYAGFGPGTVDLFPQALGHGSTARSSYSAAKRYGNLCFLISVQGGWGRA